MTASRCTATAQSRTHKSRVLDVTAPNVSSPMSSTARDLVEKGPYLLRGSRTCLSPTQSACSTSTERLDDFIDPVRERLVRQLAAADRTAMVTEGRTPAARALWAADFRARTTRPRCSTSHPATAGLMSAATHSLDS